jgi:maltose/moltooligosaccharide transporter
MSSSDLRPTPDYVSPSPKTYTVGTLTYTRFQLAQVFVWLLLGDFCLHLMDNGVVPTLVPLQFEALGASKTLYNLVAVTLVNVMYTVLVPVVSVWSDRTRTRLGRRRPFLLVATPLLALSLIALGFSVNIARFGQELLPGWLGGYSTAGVALAVTVVLFVAFKFFDLFPQSVYYYLWPDVIPGQWMGVFGALFRVFYAGGSLIFNQFLIGLAKEHPEEIYIGSAVAYLVAFTLLVWRVKEPEYPPPDLTGADRPFMVRLVALTASYFRDCFSHPFYLKYYAAMAAFQMGYQVFIANLIYYGKNIYGDTPEGLKQYGQVMAWKDGLWIGIYLALVPVMIKLHPVRAGVVGYLVMTLTAVVAMLIVHDPATFRIMTIAMFASVALYLGGTAAIGPRLLPPSHYGQFASAGALVFRLSVAMVGWIAGIVFDSLGIRFIYAWLAIFLAIGTVLMLWLYFDWQKLGGEKGYVAPLPGPRDSPTEPRQGGFDVVTKD